MLSNDPVVPGSIQRLEDSWTNVNKETPEFSLEIPFLVCSECIIAGQKWRVERTNKQIGNWWKIQLQRIRWRGWWDTLICANQRVQARLSIMQSHGTHIKTLNRNNSGLNKFRACSGQLETGEGYNHSQSRFLHVSCPARHQQTISDRSVCHCFFLLKTRKRLVDLNTNIVEKFRFQNAYLRGQIC